MVLRTAHGAGRSALVRVETAPVDELPVGIPGEAHEELPTDRGARGKFAPGNTLAARGGNAKRGKTRLASTLGLSRLTEGEGFAPYRRKAVSFRRTMTSSIALTVGGGVCGPGPSSMIATAALQLAWSRYFSDIAAQIGDPVKAAELALKASALGDKSRQSLLTAHELAAVEAAARPKPKSVPF